MIVKDLSLSLNIFPNKNTYTTLTHCILQGFLIVFLNFPDVRAILVCFMPFMRANTRFAPTIIFHFMAQHSGLILEDICVSKL